MKRKISPLNIFFRAGIISLSLIYIILWAQMITNPAERTGTDFIAFYTAGRVAREHGVAHVYNIAYQQEIQEKLLGFSLANHQPLLYNHLPFLIPLLYLIIQKNYILSFFLWLLLLFIVYGASFLLLFHILPQNWHKKTKKRLILSGFLFFPLFSSLLLGQDTAFLFLGVTLFLYGIRREEDALAGLGLAITTVRPHLSLVLALPLLFKKRKAFLHFLVFGGGLALFSFALLGTAGTKSFINILKLSGAGEWYGMQEAAMFNLSGLLIRLFPALPIQTVHIIGWSAYLLAIIALAFTQKRAEKLQDEHLSLSIIFSLFFAPHLHYHDLSLLLIPLFLYFKTSQRNAHLIPLGISLLLVFTHPLPFLYYLLPYFLMISLILLFVKTHKNTNSFPSV